MSKRKMVNSKIFILIATSLILTACQHASSPDNNEAAKTVDLQFNLPSNIKDPPQISKGPADAKVKSGDFINLSVSPGTGAVLLVINDVKSPFVSGAFTLRVTPGNSFKETIAPNRTGTYKYTLIDVSGGPSTSQRPPLDPRIIVQL